MDMVLWVSSTWILVPRDSNEYVLVRGEHPTVSTNTAGPWPLVLCAVAPSTVSTTVWIHGMWYMEYVDMWYRTMGP